MAEASGNVELLSDARNSKLSEADTVTQILNLRFTAVLSMEVNNGSEAWTRLVKDKVDNVERHEDHKPSVARLFLAARRHSMTCK